MTGPLLSMIHAFLGKLREGCRQDVEQLLKAVQNDDISLILKTMGTIIENYSEEGEKVSDELISDNFLQFLVDLLDWERLSTNPEFLLHVYSLSVLLGCHYPDRKIALEGMGIVTKLIEILDKEREIGKMICVQKNGVTITTCHFIANFLPTLPFSRCYEDVNKISSGILLSGPQFEETHKGIMKWIFNEEDDEYSSFYSSYTGNWENFVSYYIMQGEGASSRAISLFSKRIQEHVKVIFKTVHDICQTSSSCHLVHHTLLLKVIFWANAVDKLNNCSGIGEIVNFTQMLLSSTHEREKIIVGMAIIHSLISKHMDSFQCLQETMNNLVSIVGPIDWIEGICEIFREDDLRIPKMLVYCFQDQTFSATFHLQNDLINSMLLYVKPSHDKDRDEFEKSDVDRIYSQLSTFMRIVLKLPRNTDKIQEKFTVSDDGVQMFQCLVSFVMKALEANRVEIIFEVECNDCRLNGKYINFPQEVSLGLFNSINLDVTLGVAACGMKENDLKGLKILRQCLKLISIFHELNENWGVLFCILTSERLINKAHFISQRFTEYVKQFILEHNGKRSPFTEDYTRFEYIKDYYYLLPFDVRRFMIMEYFKRKNETEVEAFVQRGNLVNDITKKLPNYKFHNSIFNFRFAEEPGTGSGPTKEFYTEFSRECYRYDLDLWIGDPIEDSDGNVYVNSPCGLFPKPKISQKESMLKYKAIGRILGKCFGNGHQMDINFSKAFYKITLGTVFYQQLSLIDLKDVMPNVYKLAADMVDSLRIKWGIEKEESLTAEEKMEAISNITCDGSSFKDLCLNFTIPGFPEMEMKEGGKDVLLSIENVEEYLKLLVWWLLFKCPEDCANHFIGSELFYESEQLVIFNMDEIETLFCGSNVEKWTVDFLKANCVLLDGFSIDNPVINYLFEVLATLSEDEQRNFLQFTTGSTRLPYGGLKNLSPKLTIRRKLSVGTPDKYLPVSWTCSNTLFITKYSSKEMLRGKLLLAIREGNKSFQNF